MESGKKTEDNPLRVLYENWNGEISWRTITPQVVWFGTTDYHKECWLMTAFDHDKKAVRDFALKGFLKVEN